MGMLDLYAQSVDSAVARLGARMLGSGPTRVGNEAHYRGSGEVVVYTSAVRFPHRPVHRGTWLFIARVPRP